jgi:SAM-dependent methyltransferase
MSFCCILCGERSYRILYPSSIDPEAERGAPVFSTGRRVAVHGQIVKCARCGLVCTFPRDDEKTLAAAYESLNDPEYLDERSARIINASRHLKFVQRFKNARGRLLDVGCSAGFFLSVARKGGWEIVGVEPSHWAAKIARTEYGIGNVHEGFLEQQKFEDASFDVVTLWDVLEHLPDPALALATIARVLKPDGALFLNVPNIDSLSARTLGPRWVLFLREHLWYFSPRTIRLFLEAKGFSVVATKPNRVTFSLRGIFKRLRQYDSPLVAGTLKRFADNPFITTRSLTFPMGEMMVAARLDPDKLNRRKSSRARQDSPVRL